MEVSLFGFIIKSLNNMLFLHFQLLKTHPRGYFLWHDANIIDICCCSMPQCKSLYSTHMFMPTSLFYYINGLVKFPYSFEEVLKTEFIQYRIDTISCHRAGPNLILNLRPPDS